MIAAGPRRRLFVATVLTGSFLLFLVQPMVARMALPRLGGAPNVWNSAMLVYQALLLAGYAYAHLIGRLSLAMQARVHLGVLVLAGLTLPIALADLPPPAAGNEVLWVPLLFLATIGPLFFAVSAQAPLIQRWFAADPAAGNPYALYAASNLGSFAGLIAYPLLVEPLVPLRGQSWLWTAGYVALALLTFAASRSLPRGEAALPVDQAAEAEAPIGWRRIGWWFALAAVPSGLMLSTTTYLTTDIVAMPLLWVIPLGLYLLSFSIAFAERRGLAEAVERHAAELVMVLGAVTMLLATSGAVPAAIVSTVLLMVVAVALHAQLYASRPGPARLTLFYLVMSAGGAFGGVLTALIAPLVFHWSWEHPLLIVAAAALVPRPPYAGWLGEFTLSPARERRVRAALLATALVLVSFLATAVGTAPRPVGLVLALGGLVALFGLLASRWRAAFVTVLVFAMLALGGMNALKMDFAGERSRSYFGIYSVGRAQGDVVTLAHGTTLHGMQVQTPGHQLDPTTYYGRTGGIGLALGASDALFGPRARIGVVGLGVATLACYKRPGQNWTFYEIDPAILAYSTSGRFTFLERCAPDAKVVIGDARLELGRAAPASFDLLAIDAFSSDSVPLHLLTDEAFKTYLRALAPDGLLLFHISNRYIDLAPAIAAAARANGLAAIIRDDVYAKPPLTRSRWIAMARNPARLRSLEAAGAVPWAPLDAPRQAVWTDDFASILPSLKWREFL